MTVIYLFSDENCLPMYVGKTKDFKKRMKQHCFRDRFKYKTKFYNWLNKVIDQEIPYFIDILEEFDETKESWQEREIYWIENMKQNGFYLLNQTKGGDGNNGGKLSEITKLKMSKSHMGHIVTPESRLKISLSHKGKKLSLETKEKIKNCNLGKKCPESVKESFSKKVIQKDKNNNIINIFESLTKTADFLNCKKSTLSNAIKRNKNGKYKNYFWSYQNS